MVNTYYKTKTKEERRKWWNSLTLEEQTKQIEVWQAKKAQKRAKNRNNRAEDQKIPFEAWPQLSYKDWQHLQSITVKDRTNLVLYE